MYLMVTVGAPFVRSKEVPASLVLKDLVEMCRGVQHPTRGLFLRSYLCQMAKGILPDRGGAFESGRGCGLEESVEFLLTNLTEMNKLWVRMQHQGSAMDRARREQERQQLQELVGRNLHHLSQLEGVDISVYRGTVLPRVLEQVITCKDELAQQYLMDVVIQVFPDEFHLQTLDLLLAGMGQVQSGVKVHAVIGGLLTRLADFARTSPDAHKLFSETGAVDVLRVACKKIGEGSADRPPADVAALHIALMQFITAVQARYRKLLYACILLLPY